MNKSDKFSPEVRARTVRMVFEHRAEHSSPPHWLPSAQCTPASTDGGALGHWGPIYAVTDSAWYGSERARLGLSDADWQRG